MFDLPARRRAPDAIHPNPGFPADLSRRSGGPCRTRRWSGAARQRRSATSPTPAGTTHSALRAGWWALQDSNTRRGVVPGYATLCQDVPSSATCRNLWQHSARSGCARLCHGVSRCDQASCTLDCTLVARGCAAPCAAGWRSGGGPGPPWAPRGTACCWVRRAACPLPDVRLELVAELSAHVRRPRARRGTSRTGSARPDHEPDGA